MRARPRGAALLILASLLAVAGPALGAEPEGSRKAERGCGAVDEDRLRTPARRPPGESEEERQPALRTDFVGSVLADFLGLPSFAATVSGRPDLRLVELPLLRTDFDLTGDGVPEVFLTFSSTWSKNGFRWTAYDLASGSSFRRLGEVVFHERYLRVLAPGRLRVLEPKQVGLFWWVEHLLVEGELVEQERHRVVEGRGSEGERVEDELEMMRRFWKEKAIPRTRAELTAEGLEPWRDAETGQIVTGLAPIVGEEPSAPPPGAASPGPEPPDVEG